MEKEFSLFSNLRDNTFHCPVYIHSLQAVHIDFHLRLDHHDICMSLYRWIQNSMLNYPSYHKYQDTVNHMGHILYPLDSSVL